MVRTFLAQEAACWFPPDQDVWIIVLIAVTSPLLRPEISRPLPQEFNIKQVRIGSNLRLG